MRIRESCTNFVIPTIMAAVRRLGFLFRSLPSSPRNALFRSPVKDGRCIGRGIAVAAGFATGGAVLYYYYSDMCGFRGRKAPKNGTGCRALLPSLPAVAAKEKAPMFDFDEGDVYMSSHEHRFRLFSSVEYEGQLYMTPRNFIESVTMSEPRSE
ncbi:calcium uptake protein 3, mitochondrial-like [Pimephales promelas]|uniref:calcium uptake protein 3, mitochondrial-like n=1 Tax=Pimephales promelas TaxID=90988 RepID=UPI001955D533|nr:calcium uptake protein 3, mitochondrial-like [Pimephales promelas]